MSAPIPTKFADNKGQEWDLSLTVATVKRVRTLLGVDLAGMLNRETLAELTKDPVRLVDTVYAIVKPKADELKITDEQFAERIVGDTLDEIARAFIGGIVSFFTSPESRPKIAEALDKSDQAADRLRAKVDERLDRVIAEMDPEKIADAALNEALAKSGAASTTLPGSSESTPDHSALAS